MGEPAKRRGPMVGRLFGGQRINHSAEIPRLDPVNGCRRHPGPFVVAGGHLALRTHSDAVRGAETPRDDFQMGSIFTKLEQTTGVRADLAVAAAAAKSAAA